jgi:lipopolysaccharide biosynthesis glycosyltransferase
MIFCTIITADYIPWALTLQDSLIKNGYSDKCFVLVTDKELSRSEYDSLNILQLSDIANKNYESIFQLGKDELRWATKPLLMLYLLNKYERVCYMDCDIMVTGNIEAIDQELGDSKILLTPHFRTRSPLIDSEEFKFNFKHGLFNAGFIAVSRSSIEILHWWATCCNYKCEKNLMEGLWDDQRYLDAMPIFYEGVKICRHSGFNVAFWNKHELKRSVEDGKTLINGKDLIFIHFAYTTWNEIHSGTDGIAPEYAKEYNNLLIKNGWKKNLEEKYQERHVPIPEPRFLKRLKNKLKWVLFRK